MKNEVKMDEDFEYKEEGEKCSKGECPLQVITKQENNNNNNKNKQKAS